MSAQQDELVQEELSEDVDMRVEQACDFARFIPSNELNVTALSNQFDVPYYRLYRRLRGETKPRCYAHESQQYLSHSQEKAVADWIIHLSDIGRPLSKRTLTRKIQRMAELPFRPKEKWVRGFLARNPGVKLGKPSGLDPKRAQCICAVCGRIEPRSSEEGGAALPKVNV